MRPMLVDKLSLLLGSLSMVIFHGAAGHWSWHLAAGLTVGGALAGTVVRALIRSDERENRENFLRDEMNRGEVMRLCADEKELITALRDQKRIEARR